MFGCRECDHVLFLVCVCYDSVWMIKKCRKCQSVDGKVCLILERFSGFLWFYLNLNFRWIWWLLVDLSI